MKTCSKCNLEKTVDNFSKRGNSHQPWCKQCNSEHKREWIAQNRDKVRWNILWTKYRLRPADWQRMWEEQQGMCAVCEEVPPTIVDHDHSCCNKASSCGKCVRALVCSKCNVFLGYLEMNPNLLNKALRFLQR